MRFPLIRRSTHEQVVARLEAKVAANRADRDRYRQAHWAICDCHDSWDQCPCTEGGHPKDGSCGCCPIGTGMCGPLPEAAS